MSLFTLVQWRGIRRVLANFGSSLVLFLTVKRFTTSSFHQTQKSLYPDPDFISILFEATMAFLFENVPQIIQGIFFNDKTVLESPPNVDDITYKDAQMRTPLHAAAYVGDVDFVEFLLANNARVNVKDIKWYTPLHRACASNAPSVVQILLDNGADRNMRDKSWLTPLHVAAFNGSLECARLLLFYNTENGEFGTNINASDRGGHTPLHHAVYGGHIDMVRLLLMNGASVNAFDKNDRRALHWAAACNLANENNVLHLSCLNAQREVVMRTLKVLSEDSHESRLTLTLNQRNLDGFTALHLAAMSSNDGECMELLIRFCKQFDESKRSSASADADSPKPILNLELTAGEGAWTPLHLAAMHGRHRQAQTLLKNSVNVNAKDMRGYTALHMAARQGHQLVLSTLLDAGARWDARAHLGISPLHCAAISGFSSCFNSLLDVAKQNWNEVKSGIASNTESSGRRYSAALQAFRDDLGRSLVHTAALGGSVECLRTVLLSGGSPFDLDAMSRTALHFALLSTRIRSYSEESPLRVSSKSTSVAVLVRVLLKLGVDPNHRDIHGCTALHLASAFDTEGSLIRVLLRYGANKVAVLSRRPKELSFDSSSSISSSVSDAAYYPLHIAASMGNKEGVRLFLQGVSTREACRLILDSAKMTRYVPVNVSVNAGSRSGDCGVNADDEEADGEGGIKAGRVDKVDAPSHFFYSPLFLAAFCGHTDCIKVLLNTCKARGRSRHEVLSEEGEEDSEFRREIDDEEDDDDVDADDDDGGEENQKMKVESKDNISEAETISRVGESISHHPPLSDRRPCGKLTDPLGRTLLHYAAHAGRLEVCQLLLTHPLCQADPACVDNVHAWTAVHHAASQGHGSVVGCLLRYSAKEDPGSELVNFRDKEGRTALMLAAENKHTSVIELLCSLTLRPPRPVSIFGRSCDAHIVRRVNIVDRQGRTALHRSAALGHTEAVKILLKAGASLTAASNSGKQVLHFASISGCKGVLDVLLQTINGLVVGSHVADGSRLFAPSDSRGLTPLHYAVNENHDSCIERLLRTSKYKSLTGNTYTPVHCAAAIGNSVVMKTLLDAYPIPLLKLKDARGSTPLHIAAMANQINIIQLLLSSHSEESPGSRWLEEAVNALDNCGRTALMSAALCGAAKAVDLLLFYQRELEDDPTRSLARRDNDGFNVLHLALCGPSEEVALCLLHRSDVQDLVNVGLPDGRTPLHLASEKGFTKAAGELIKRGANSFRTDNTGKLPICSIIQSEEYSKCQMTLLFDMIPQLADMVETPQSAMGSRQASHNPMADSIRSSDPEFY
ncbi:hypothetical protein Aperf_G00000080488 [Anoplocephala perfoliata]